MISSRKLISALVGGAMLSTSIVPAFAADMGTAVSVGNGKATAMEQVAYGHRDRWRRHNDRIDGGDILAGIGILAGIAIIADVASKSERNDRRRDDRPVYRDDNERDYSPNRNEPFPPSYGSDGASNDLGEAVSACSAAAERSAGNGARVQEIRSVTRNGNGWRVEGGLSGRANDSFTCSATNGRVDDVRINGAF